MNTVDNDYGYKFGNYSVDLNKITRDKPVSEVICLLTDFCDILKENIIIYNTTKEMYLDIFNCIEMNDKKLIVSVIGNKVEDKQTKIFIISKSIE